MKHVEKCENHNCRYNKDEACSLDSVLETFQTISDQGSDINTAILSELEKSGTCPRF